MNKKNSKLIDTLFFLIGAFSIGIILRSGYFLLTGDLSETQMGKSKDLALKAGFALFISIGYYCHSQLESNKDEE